MWGVGAPIVLALLARLASAVFERGVDAFLAPSDELENSVPCSNEWMLTQALVRAAADVKSKDVVEPHVDRVQEGGGAFFDFEFICMRSSP